MDNVASSSGGAKSLHPLLIERPDDKGCGIVWQTDSLIRQTRGMNCRKIQTLSTEGQTTCPTRLSL